MAKFADNLKFTLYSAPQCHLCNDALALLEPYIAQGASLAKLDITLDPLLQARYGTRIPVLAISGKELNWPFDTQQLELFLKSISQI